MKITTIKGHRNNLKGAISACDNGAEVTLDLTTARKVLEALDFLTESNSAPGAQNPDTLKNGHGPAEIWVTHYATDWGYRLDGVRDKPWDDDYLQVAPPITTYASNERYVRGDLAEVIALRAEVERLRELAADLEQFVPHEVVECRGDKCRQQWCASCFGWDDAEAYVASALAAHTQRVNAKEDTQ